MASRHLTLRLPDETFERLDRQSRIVGQSRSDVARTFIEEGLRMEAHPGIVFRPGPAGRRPALADGPDIWEVARVFRDCSEPGPDTVVRTSELTGLSTEQVRIAMRYYANYRDEIDEWIRRVDDEAEQAEAAWRREQDLLQR